LNKESKTAATVDSRWRNLIKIGGIAAFLIVVFSLIEVAIEASGGSGLTSTPSSVQEWFTLLQTNPLLGLSILGIFETIFFPLGVLMFMGLYFPLRRTSESLMAIGTALYFIGTTIYFASNNAFAMLNLSSQYTVATSEVQKSMLLAAGQAVMATEQGTGMIMTFVLGSLAGIIVSIVMLRSKTFSKPVAIVGIIANVLGLFGSSLGLAVWTINGLLMMVWTFMVGRRLLQISRSPPKLEVAADKNASLED
jgi:hypothetical protein